MVVRTRAQPRNEPRLWPPAYGQRSVRESGCLASHATGIPEKAQDMFPLHLLQRVGASGIQRVRPYFGQRSTRARIVPCLERRSGLDRRIQLTARGRKAMAPAALGG
jgi:hypothetical protein